VTGHKLLRAHSGFWNKKRMARLKAAGWLYSIGVRQQPPIKAAITRIPEQEGRPLADYSPCTRTLFVQTLPAHRFAPPASDRSGL
jgi:hypothetical protein